MLDLTARLVTMENREIKILDVRGSKDPFPLKGLIEQSPGSDTWRVAEWDENGVYNDPFFWFRRLDLKEFTHDLGETYRTYIGNKITAYRAPDGFIYGDIEMPRRYDDIQIRWSKKTGFVDKCVCSKYLWIPKPHWHSWRLVVYKAGQKHHVTHPSLCGATSIKQAELKKVERNLR